MEKHFQRTILQKFLWLAVAVFLSMPAHAATYSAEELDTLVSTIALYPDPLLAHVLSASTHKDEIPSASLWASSHKNMKGEVLSAEMENAELDYDASVLALIPFPSILSTMAKYSVWTAQLGEAVSNQNEDVMKAVQRMRNAAYAHGNLKTDQQNTISQKVIENRTVITIEPVRAEYIYVPVYNPSVVYYVYSDRYVPMRYSYGVWTGHWYSDWVWNDSWFEWHAYSMHHHPRPPRHYRHPPRHGGPTYAPRPPRPGNDHRLPPKSSAQPQPSTKHTSVPSGNPQKDPIRFDQSKPIIRDHSINNFGNVTKTPSNGSSSNSYRKDEDDRNGNYSDRNSNQGRSYDQNNSNGGFRKSLRR